MKELKLSELKVKGQKEVIQEKRGDVVYCLTQLPNGQLASGSSDKTIKLWDIRCVQTLKGHNDMGESYELCK